MTNRTLDKLIWVLVYAGLFGAGLGVWFMDHHQAVGWTVFVSGSALVIAGAVLIWVRSHRP